MLARKARRTPKYVFGFLLLVAVGFAVVWRALEFRPLRQNEEPIPLTFLVAKNIGDTNGVVFYQYDLGGFIDHQWLWRIDANSTQISNLIRELHLKPAESIPKQFWKMPPKYWPRVRPNNAQAFQSAGFHPDIRGNDGPHFFLLHDDQTNRAYVWFKDNF